MDDFTLDEDIMFVLDCGGGPNIYPDTREDVKQLQDQSSGIIDQPQAWGWLLLFVGTETLHRRPSSIRLDKNDEEIKEQQYTVIEKYSIYEHIIQIEYNVRNVNKYELISYNGGVSVLKYVCIYLSFI